MNYHRERFGKLTFRALALRQSETRNSLKGEQTGTRHTDKTVERKGGTGEGRQPPTSPHAQENVNAQKTLTKKPTKPLQSPLDQEHEESRRMRIYNSRWPRG